jgi:hypothetical protein
MNQTRVDGIKRVAFKTQAGQDTQTLETLETDEDCSNIQIDVQECIWIALNKSEERLSRLIIKTVNK